MPKSPKSQKSARKADKSKSRKVQKVRKVQEHPKHRKVEKFSTFRISFRFSAYGNQRLLAYLAGRKKASVKVCKDISLLCRYVFGLYRPSCLSRRPFRLRPCQENPVARVASDVSCQAGRRPVRERISTPFTSMAFSSFQVRKGLTLCT